MRKILLTLLVSAGLLANSLAQKSISGTVTDEENKPLPGVSVIVKGTTTGTLTDAGGVFKLSVPANAQKLVFSFVGMNSTEVDIAGTTVFNIVLKQDVVGLEEVVVIGYGTAKKKDLTGSISSVKATRMENEKPQSVQDLLRGNVSGLEVGFSTMAKGTGSLQIRGTNSLLTSTYPLIVVDGVIYSGALEDINPNDIESIDVLKDASSAAVFGARAANGVIMVTIKKGQQGKPVINLNSSVGLATMASMADVYGPKAFINWRSDLMKSLNYYNSATNQKLYIFDNPDNLPSGVTMTQWLDGKTGDPVDIWLARLGLISTEIANYKANTPTDWVGMVFQNGFRQDHNLSLSGKKEEMTYYWSIGYTDNEGIIVGDRYKTLRSRVNLDGKVTDWMSVGLNTQFARRDESAITASWGAIVSDPPYGPLYYPDGKTLRYSPTDFAGRGVVNPVYDKMFQSRIQVYNTFISSLYANIRLPLGITYTATFAPRLEWYEFYNHQSALHELWSKFGGQADRRQSSVYNWQIDNLLKWTRTFNVHQIDITLLANAEKYQSWSNSMSIQGFSPTDALGFHNMSAGTSSSMSISSSDQYSTGDALMARLFYSLMNRYMLTLSVRRDGYSAFGLKHPRGTFPSAALGWVFTDESFLKNDILTYGKLRFSWGSNGNREIGRYAALSDMSTGKYPYQTLTGTIYESNQLYVNNMSNPDLRWEKTQAVNLGVDFTFMNGLFDGSIDAYKKTTRDLLVNRSLPTILGFTSVTSNLGEISNTGIELLLNSRVMNRDRLKWRISATFSANHNEIVHLYGDMVDVKDSNGNVIGQKESDDITNNWFIGHSIGEIWQPKIVGVWQLGQETDAAKYGQFPGDFHLEDVDNNGKINQADYQFQGQTIPVFRWNMRQDFNIYRNIDFSFNMYSYLGHKSQFNAAKNRQGYPDSNNSYVCGYWTPENPTNKYARLYSSEGGAVFDVWRKRSFVRLDNVSLAYNVPTKFLSRFKVSNLRLIGTIRNVGWWSPEWNFWDPENSGPNPRYYTFAINLTL
jgi:TonB-dependent starch-binding outer membrane protein SusC